MSKLIAVRNVPDQARNELAARAARQGQSVQDFLRADLIALADRPNNRSLMQTGPDEPWAGVLVA
ncbi:FitA-like ribbon-helix-helix domain-containing protein [Wenzhouxiangella sp. EGI_FJ10305]|uniref:FitA-like ribbon-helix-helix domain-containing protein n=1 Tax=Wenzhouxiangella sp. EGI_FJ10305 TaxID=3243768 RepID=UPI0035D6A2FD